ncbi:MAG: hypothetical protein ACREK8_02945 [Gemmatimonadales bacterium]
MSTSEGNSQSAAGRRAAEAEMRGLVAKVAPAHQRLTGTMRRWLRKRLPSAHEIVYEYSGWLVISYSPNERGYEGVLTIRVSPSGVALYFNRGKELSDPEKLLQGSGKQVRWIPVESASTLARPTVVRLVDEAIARNPLPFAQSGRGPVVVRAAGRKTKTKAKQRQGAATRRAH